MKRIYILIAAVSLIACQQKETLNSKSVLTVPNKARTELDNYIYNTFSPYNIVVNYNYIDADFDMRRYFYPPTESKVEPLLRVIKKVWIDPYETVGGSDFVKIAAPRQISLIGGYNVNQGGTITLGIADSGMKITLFNVDQFNTSNEAVIREYFHTIHHEYCHIINQRKPYDEEFGKITPAYSADWFNITTADANNAGFISPYAKLNDKEDFAEMTSLMLNMSKTKWDQKVNAISDEKGKAIIRKKEAFVADYFKSKWNIDIYKLQAKVEEETLSVLQ